MDYAGLRERMVREQIEARGSFAFRLLDVMRSIPRHQFVDPGLAHSAYGDHALPIGHGQTISQPYMVALMTELLQVGPESRILEVGTGSGYQAAVLSRLAQVVFTIERIPPLALRAQTLLVELGYDNVIFRIGDGTLGWRRFAPFDGIVVAAGAPDPPPTLIDQLAPGGRLVVPAGDRTSQQLRVIERTRDSGVIQRDGIACTFVPLIGREGWGGQDPPPR